MFASPLLYSLFCSINALHYILMGGKAKGLKDYKDSVDGYRCGDRKSVV